MFIVKSVLYYFFAYTLEYSSILGNNHQELHEIIVMESYFYIYYLWVLLNNYLILIKELLYLNISHIPNFLILR